MADKIVFDLEMIERKIFLNALEAYDKIASRVMTQIENSTGEPCIRARQSPKNPCPLPITPDWQSDNLSEVELQFLTVPVRALVGIALDYKEGSIAFNDIPIAVDSVAMDAIDVAGEDGTPPELDLQAYLTLTSHIPAFSAATGISIRTSDYDSAVKMLAGRLKLV